MRTEAEIDAEIVRCVRAKRNKFPWLTQELADDLARLVNEEPAMPAKPITADAIRKLWKELAEPLGRRLEALESGHSGPAQLVPNHEKRLDALEASTALEELRHLVEALKQNATRLDLVATRHDERLATLEQERGVRLLTALEAEKERLRGEVSGVSPLHAASRRHVEVYDPGEAVPGRHPDALDEAYTERNRLVALLARIYPSGIRKTAIKGWDPCWHNCVFVDTPQGQMSWHYHDRDADLFAGLPPYTKPWDGHSTPEKYERLAQLTRSYWARTPEPADITTEAVPERAPGITSGKSEVFHEAMNEAFREGRRRERQSLVGRGDGVTVIIRDYPALIGDVVSGCKALRATRVLVDAAGPGACVLRALEQAGLPAEALPKGGL